MRCASCGTENEPGGRFCEACGSSLTAACPSCGEPVSPEARFCRNCGTALKTDAPSPAPAHVAAAPAEAAAAPAPTAAQTAPATSDPVAERRLVTVLFADLVGFTTLAEDRDPETTRELLTRYFDAARQAIERHGGTVEKFIGDAVMAVWGTPVAHEDDAERAVRAAFELLAEVPLLSPELSARAGVLTGEAAVTLGATDQGMVAGDLVNTAARLQGVAEPGTVLVGEPTMRAAERAIVFEEVGEQSLKGKMAPVPAWRAVRVVAQRGGRQRTDAFEPPFVGRDEELRLLKDQLHAPSRDGRARLVSITGPAGIGKSRLVWELEKYMDGITENVYWHRGRSPSYGEGITFWALGEMVRRRAQLAEDADEATTREGIHAAVNEYITDPDERAIIEPALLTLLGLGETAGGRDALFPAWRLFFERISERGTTALVFEDLQWADSGLLDFIDHLLEWAKSRPILVVTLARPELFDKRPDWGAGRRAFTSLALDPLSDDAIRTLLEGVVPGLPDSAVATIVSRAEGMPLYAVETVRTLVAEGRIERDGEVFRPVGDLSSLTVPESLRSLIASRLDALDPADRSLIQDASVLGQVFDVPTLAMVTGIEQPALEERLRDLTRRELVEIETDPRSPERGQYKFVQALIREVAYGTLALRDRRSRHLAVARHYEALGDDETAGALASHYLAALEASTEGPEADAVAAQARIALRAAADRAQALGSYAQALAHIERALAITTDEAERAELLERAAEASNISLVGDAEEFARAAIAAREAMGDAAGVFRATAQLAHILLDGAKLDEATELLETSLARSEGVPDPDTEAELYTVLSRAYMRQSRDTEAIAMADRALAIAEPRNLIRIIADAMNNKASSLASMGRRRESSALLEAAVDLATTGGWRSLELRLRNNLAVTLADDDPARSTAISRQMREIAERIGNVHWYVNAGTGAAGGEYSEARDWDGVLAFAEEATPRTEPLTYSWIGVRCLVPPIVAAREGIIEPPIPDAETATLGPTLRWQVYWTMAESAVNAAEWERAIEYIRLSLETGQAQSNEPFLLAGEALAEVGRHDVEGLRAVVERMRGGVFQGAMSQASQACAEGCLLALDGRAAEGARRIGEGIDELRRLEQFFEVARWEMAAVSVLPHAPEAPAWAAEARSLLEGVGATAMLRQLETLSAAIMPAAAVPVAARTTPEVVADPS